jgi:hypothetical protein
MKLEEMLFNERNVRYALADAGGFVAGITAATFATIWLKEAGASDGLNVALTLGAKMTGFCAGNISSYLAIHHKDYRTGEKTVKKDIKNLLESNFHGAWSAGILKAGGHYAVLKSGLMPYYFIPIAVYPIAGLAGTIVRHWKNYHNGFFDIEKKDANGS